MINLSSIIEDYPQYLRSFPRAILREYLQYKILSYIFQTKYARKLNFIGGTAIRFLYDSQRFSEDLDFDNKELSPNEFEEIVKDVEKKLTLEGLSVETKSYQKKSVFHCKIRLPGIYHGLGLSGHRDETLMIKIDCQNQEVDYKIEKKLIRKLDVLSTINISPADVLFAQKIAAYFDRIQGRDLYDIFFLSSKTKPNYEYLKIKQNIATAEELKKRLLLRLSELDISQLANDANRFLFFPERDKNIILMFAEFVEAHDF